MSAEPIKLKDYDFHGFAMNGALAGEEVQVTHRAMLTSDSPAFYVFMRGVCDSLADATHAAGVLIQPDHVSHLSLVIHTDRTADLYLGNFAMTLELMAKKDIAVSEADIADIRGLRLHDVKLDPTDKVLICFKVNWKFGLYFDLGDEEPLDMSGLERDLGHLYRLLRFEAAYDALADENFVARFFARGWFPFVEIFGPESERLLKAWRFDFNIAGEEEALLRRFDAARIGARTSSLSRPRGKPLMRRRTGARRRGSMRSPKGLSTPNSQRRLICLAQFEEGLRQKASEGGKVVPLACVNGGRERHPPLAVA